MVGTARAARQPSSAIDHLPVSLMNNGQLLSLTPIRSLLGIRILGTGSYVPELVVSNRDLQESHGFDPDWIVNRTGIHERRFALPHQATSDLCIQAALRCLRSAGREPADVDLLVVATFTPDMAFPSTANLVQDRLKLACPAFDVQAACAGFVFALVIAAQFVATGTSKNALVVGGDCNSRVINPGDQKSFPLFGDGAGAVLLTKGEPDQGLVAYQLGSDGSGMWKPDSAVSGGARAGAALLDDGRPCGLQMGGAHSGRLFDCRSGARSSTCGGRALVHSAPGQRSNHSCRERCPWVSSGRGFQEPGALRQHVGGIDSVGAR
jgi:hypothetical protein